LRNFRVLDDEIWLWQSKTACLLGYAGGAPLEHPARTPQRLRSLGQGGLGRAGRTRRHPSQQQSVKIATPTEAKLAVQAFVEELYRDHAADPVLSEPREIREAIDLVDQRLRLLTDTQAAAKSAGLLM
jgi:hypothetical protein